MRYFITMVIIGSQLIGCGVDTGGTHKVEVEDSKQTVQVQTTLDKVLEICEVVKTTGEVIPYRLWTETQKECFKVFDFGEYLGGFDFGN